MEKKFKLTTMVLMVALAILGVFALSSCEKNKLEPIDQEVELVVQTFGLESVTSNIDLKSWDYDTWFSTDQYTTVLATLTLTNVTDPLKTYTADVTVQNFLNKTVSIEMLKGTYNVTYETLHQRSTDPWFINDESVDIDKRPSLAEKIDVKIIMPNVEIQGTPIELNGTVQDLLIVVDIPNVTEVQLSTTLDWTGAYNRLLRNEYTTIIDEKPVTNYYHWGYFGMNEYERNNDNLDYTDGLKLKFLKGTTWVEYNIKDYTLGKVYLFTTNQNTSFQINIPDMEQEIIIVS